MSVEWTFFHLLLKGSTASVALLHWQRGSSREWLPTRVGSFMPLSALHDDDDDDTCTCLLTGDASCILGLRGVHLGAVPVVSRRRQRGRRWRGKEACRQQ